MDLLEAFQLLEGTNRFELRDPVFGDREVIWRKDGVAIANGYFGGQTSVVGFPDIIDCHFNGDEARALMECGTLKFLLKRVRTSLTKENVFDELTKEN
jgi:hypothetical protein